MTPQFWQAFLAGEFAPQKSRAILESLGSSAGDPQLSLLKLSTLSSAERGRIQSAPNLDPALQKGVHVIEEQDFPEYLRDAASAPPAVFYWGNHDALAQPCVAIVGTRSASTYGKACAQKFAEAIAQAGATVVSGGALGIDAAAHKGALAVGGRTIAVVAGGVDNVYPAVHAMLFEQMREQGGLISQFAVGSRPSEYKFLVRNELIAALSMAVLVIEAPGKSGAIKTAVSAAELGREVFVVPANIDMLTFRGSFNLIRDGATLVDHPDQVIEALGLTPMLHLKADEHTSAVGQQILAVLTSIPKATEKIVQETGLDTSELLSELTMLELEGRVIRDSVGYSIRP